MTSKRKFSRRDVLKGLAASVEAAPLFVSGRALGLEDKAAASERITVGHIGVGNRGTRYFRVLAAVPEFQSVAAADCYENRRNGVAAVCKGKAYRDFRELLARDDIDAVVIATPDHWHVPIGILAARAGKHVYIEKPLGVTIEQDLAMQKVVEEKSVIFQYGTQQRSMPHCWVGCELVRRGVVGKIHTIEVDAPDGGSGGSTMEVPFPRDSISTCGGPSPMRPYTNDLCKPPGTYWVYSQSIGYLGGWGAHPLDIMVWGSDADLSGLVTVEGTGVIPKEGLYDCVYNWDMQIMMGDVKLIFRPGADRTKFIGDQGLDSGGARTGSQRRQRSGLRSEEPGQAGGTDRQEPAGEHQPLGRTSSRRSSPASRPSRMCRMPCAATSSVCCATSPCAPARRSPGIRRSATW